MNPLPSPRRVAVPVLVRDGKVCQGGGGGGGPLNPSLKSEASVNSIGSSLSEFSQSIAGLSGPCLPSFSAMPPNYTLMHHQPPWW
jgi:hypothetical protein